MRAAEGAVKGSVVIAVERRPIEGRQRGSAAQAPAGRRHDPRRRARGDRQARPAHDGGAGWAARNQRFLGPPPPRRPGGDGGAAGGGGGGGGAGPPATGRYGLGSADL